jgi:putative membrane protein
MVKETQKEVKWKQSIPTQVASILEDRSRFAIFVLSIFYTVGIFGFIFQIHPDFVMLTPFQLLLALGLMLWAHARWDVGSVVFCVSAFIIGYGAEVFGVQTGILFGEYVYNEVLGWKVWDTPLMIGINWILVAYSAGMLINHFMKDSHWVIKSILGAALMVLLDFFIEPVAIEFGFWTWTADGHPPLQNYLGWFWVALPVMALFFLLVKKQQNKVGYALFIIQFLFFFLIGLTI